MSLIDHLWYGNYQLFLFFFSQLPLIKSLPPEIKNPYALEKSLLAAGDKTLKVSGSKSAVDAYNRDMANLKAKIKGFGRDRAFKRTQMFFFFTRIATCVAALYGDLFITISISLLQFIIAPYSLFVSFAMFVALSPPFFVGHYISYGFLQFIGNSMLSDATVFAWVIPVTPMFIVVFFALDQAVCAYATFFDTGSGKPAPVPSKKLLLHILYGFINTKSYTFIILVHMYHAECQIPLLVWLLDAVLGISPFLARCASEKFLHWAALFYHQHRIAHIPCVYEHAHKMHHFLYDSTAFDAHIYGSGAPEEWFMLMLEVLGAVWGGICPVTFGFNVMWISWTNKVGHTRKAEYSDGNNNHTDHHTYHSKNFGIFGISTDLYFATEARSGHRHELAGHVITKREEGDRIMLVFTPTSQVKQCDDDVEHVEPDKHD